MTTGTARKMVLVAVLYSLDIAVKLLAPLLTRLRSIEKRLARAEEVDRLLLRVLARHHQ